METNQTKAIAAFKSGLNCAQAVVVTFAEDLNFDKDAASNLAVGFGGGMGRMQETCGAVTGAFMVLGMYNSAKYQDNQALKNATYPLIRQFDTKFKVLHQTTNCRSLLQCDLSTDEGHAFAVENKLFEKICEKCLTDAVGIVEELID